jgi:ABC-type Fe3+ transport system permease subunit
MMSYTLFAAVNCKASSFLGIPKWYAYLPTTTSDGVCSPSLANINDVWLIVAAVIEILLRVAALLAVALVIYGGVSYTMSQGEPDKTSKARNTIINAGIGLTIAVLAAVIVAFVAGSVN